MNTHLSTAGTATVNWWSLEDAADAARAALDPGRWNHLATGAEGESSIRLAREAFEAWAFVPRVLRGAGRPVLDTHVLGLPAAAPILVAPIGTHALFHPVGERGTATAAAAIGLPPVVSQMTSMPFAAIGEVVPEWMIQLYPLRDRGLFRAFVDEAVDGGAKAAVLTVDVPVLGRRVRDLRGGFLSGRDSRPYIQDALEAQGYGTFWDAWAGDLGWRDVEALVDELALPVALKGILHPDDARQAVAAGAAAVWVSAHGGRQLDWAIAPLDALPRIADAVAGAVPLIVDGGVRSGADVAKALCLGADAVAAGRPIIWGLAAGGAAGAERVLRLLVDQLENVVWLLGAAGPAALGPDDLARIR